MAGPSSADRTPLSDQTLYGFDVADHDLTLAEIDQSLPVPNLKVLVDAFPTGGAGI
jgi:hypothetical protein